MKHLPQRQQQILEHLLEKPEGVTADDLCVVCDVTKTAIKEHLAQLEHLGYVAFRDQKGGVGRPRRFYFLSNQGSEAFPRQYSWLSTALLEEISSNFSASQLTKLLEGLAETTVRPLRAQLESLPRKQRLELIVKVMNDLGYRARLKEVSAKNAVIEASNCVYHAAAQKHPQLCQFDIGFLKRTSALDVNLECCIARGASSCRFSLR
ncbi:MAG TPA: HTH domain-containing protein [Bdellovibrionales bacterium]|nr:HTH domain-containing protein [Bdellovibrionales bacterium]